MCRSFPLRFYAEGRMLTLKQPDEFRGHDKEGRAVAHASFDVHNALKGAETKKGLVFLHDLRLEQAGETAWIDHLILHRYGLALIESRTCSKDFQCDGELWFRRDSEAWREVLSPALRLQRYKDIVTDMLQEAEAFLLERPRNLATRLSVDLYVSVAHGVPCEPDLSNLGVVVRASELHDLLRSQLLSYAVAESVNPLGHEVKLSPAELERMGLYLLKQHRALPLGAKFSQAGLQRYFRRGKSIHS